MPQYFGVLEPLDRPGTYTIEENSTRFLTTGTVVLGQFCTYKAYIRSELRSGYRYRSGLLFHLCWSRHCRLSLCLSLQELLGEWVGRVALLERRREERLEIHRTERDVMPQAVRKVGLKNTLRVSDTYSKQFADYGRWEDSRSQRKPARSR